MKRYAIDRHPLVQQDFFEIARIIGDYASYDIAERKISEIELSIANLTDFPHIGSLRDDIVPRLRAIPSAEKATICFSVDDETRIVKIICITYAGQDWQSIARNRE